MIPSRRNENIALATSVVCMTYTGIVYMLGASQKGLALHGLALLAVLAAGVGLLSFFHAMMVRLALREKQETADLSEQPGLFEGDQSESQIRDRNLKQFEKYFVPSTTVIFAIIEFSLGVYLLRRGAVETKVELVKAAASTALVGAAVLYLAGSYIAGLAFKGRNRVLRAVAGETVGLAWLAAFAGLMTLLRFTELQTNFDAVVGRVIAVVLILRSADKAIAVLMELYRPRGKGEERLLYESRVNGLFAQPRGLLARLAETLNYQFGLQITENNVSRFMTLVLPLLLLFHVVVLMLFSCLAFVNTGEQALLERWGRPHASRPVLEPGMYVKLPWPIDKMYRERVDEIKSFTIDGKQDPELGLWKSIASANLSPYLCPDSKRSSSVSILSGQSFVQYRVKDLQKYFYTSSNAQSLLRIIARRELVRFLGGAEMNSILANGRAEVDKQLRQRLQVVADERHLGVEILAVGLRYLQAPDPLVVDAFQSVVAAEEIQTTLKLEAEGEKNQLLTDKHSQSEQIRSEAKSYRDKRVRLAQAGAASYTELLPLYRKHRKLFKARAYFDLMEMLQNNQKIILATDVEDQVIKLDLKKSKSELFDFVEGTK